MYLSIEQDRMTNCEFYNEIADVGSKILGHVNPITVSLRGMWQSSDSYFAARLPSAASRFIF